MAKFKSTNQGASLVGVMVAVGVGLVIAFAMATQLTNSAREVQHLEKRSDLFSLRNYLNEAFDCGKTVANLASGGCNVGDAVAVYSLRPSPNEIIVAKDSTTKIGRYSLRASCANCPTCPSKKMLRIDYAILVGAKGKFSKDSLTGKAFDWQDIYKGIPLGCALP